MFFNVQRAGRVAAVSALTVAALGLSACTGSTPTTSQDDVKTVGAELAGAIDDAVANALALSGSTEAVVGVWNGDSQAYVRGYGEGVTAATTFRGAQATQPFTCALLLDLVSTGQVKLDRKVSADLTRQSQIDDITYAQLCDQTSGLGDFKKGYADVNANNPARIWADKELLSNGLANSPLSWPGLDVHLSDTNVLLLDRALRVKFQQDTSTMLSEHVFVPLKMSSTSYPTEFAPVEPPKGSMNPLTYEKSGGKPVCETGTVNVAQMSPSMLRGAGSALTTVTDLKTFYTEYLAGAFGGDAAAAEVTEFAPAKNPKRDEEGNPTEEPDTAGNQIGFAVEKVGPLIGRSGAITGTITAAYTDPETQLTVVVALNNSTAGAGFAKALAFQLASLTGAELTWTAEDQGAKLTELAVCQEPAEGEDAPTE